MRRKPSTQESAKADALLADVETQQRHALDSLAVNVADTSARRGQIALTRLRYNEAAGHFANAAAVFPPGSTFEDKRIGYLEREADALYRQGSEFGDNGALLSAIGRWKRLVELQPRERVPRDWAMIQNNLGNALSRLGERESGTAKLDEAVAAYREAPPCAAHRSPGHDPDEPWLHSFQSGDLLALLSTFKSWLTEPTPIRSFGFISHARASVCRTQRAIWSAAQRD